MNEEYKNFIAELYEQNSIVLYNIAYSYIKNDADARDIVEDVFVLALKRASSLYRHENPGGWLYKVLYYKLKEYYRSKNISISGEAVKILTEDEFDISDIRSESSLEQDVVERISFYRFLQTLPVRERKYIISTALFLYPVICFQNPSNSSFEKGGINLIMMYLIIISRKCPTNRCKIGVKPFN